MGCPASAVVVGLRASTAGAHPVFPMLWITALALCQGPPGNPRLVQADSSRQGTGRFRFCICLGGHGLDPLQAFLNFHGIFANKRQNSVPESEGQYGRGGEVPGLWQANKEVV